MKLPANVMSAIELAKEDVELIVGESTEKQLAVALLYLLDKIQSNQISSAINVINNAQTIIWELHHTVKAYDDEIGVKIWEQTLQIEHALLELNDALYGKREYL